MFRKPRTSPIYSELHDGAFVIGNTWTMFETLRSERVMLRPVRSGDAAALHARRNEPDNARYQSWTLPYPMELATVATEHVASIPEPVPDDWWMVTITDPDDTQIYGDLALHLTWSGKTVEVGCTLATEFHGKGIGAAALELILRWAFEKQVATRVHANVHPKNVAAARTLEWAGFEFEGHLRNSYWVGEENSDDWIYGLTPETWRAWSERPRHRPDVVELREINPSQVRPLINLQVHHTQRSLVSAVATSLAEAGFPPVDRGVSEIPWPRMVIADNELVGFVMVSMPNDLYPEPYLWRLLIDRRHQRRGIGTMVLDAVVAEVRSWGQTSLTVSYVEGPGSPKPVYDAYGFVPTGEIDDGETVARLILDPPN